MQWRVVRSDQSKPSEPDSTVASYSGPNQNVRAYPYGTANVPSEKVLIGLAVSRAPGMCSPLSR